MLADTVLQRLRTIPPGNEADALLARALGMPTVYLPAGEHLRTFILRGGARVMESGHYLRTGLTTGMGEMLDVLPPTSTSLNTVFEAATVMAARTRQHGAPVLLQVQQQFGAEGIAWLAVAKRIYHSDITILTTHAAPVPVQAAFHCLLTAAELYNAWAPTVGLRSLLEAP